MWVRMMACNTELRLVDKNLAESEVSDRALIVVAIFFLNMVLRRLFSTSVGVPTSVTLGDTKKYVLMGFTVLLLITIYSSTGALYEL